MQSANKRKINPPDAEAKAMAPLRASSRAAAQAARRVAATDPPAKKAKVSKADAEAARVVAATAAEEARQKDIKTIAAAEDQIRREQKDEQQNGDRPDLQTFANYVPPAPPPAASMNEVDVSLEGMAIAGPNDPIDQDYTPSGGDEDDTSMASANSDDLFSDEEKRNQYKEMKENLLKKKKEKKIKGELRNKITQARRVKPNVPYAAKDDTVEEKAEMVADVKKQKKATALEGFRKDWDKAQPVTVTTSATKTSSTNTGTPVRASRTERAAANNALTNAPAAAPIKPVVRIVSKQLTEPKEVEVGAELDQGFNDEKPVLVAAARASKATALSQANGTLAMGLKTKKIPISDETKESAVPGKKNYSNKDLPLKGVPNGLQKWQHGVMPTVLAWVCTVPNSFDVNSHPDFAGVVSGAWDEVYDGDAAFSDVVVHVAGAAVRTWRSKIGKEALDILRDHFESQQFRKQEARAKFVRDQLEDCRYVYEDPVNKTGAYRVPLLLQVYAYHLGLIEGKTDAWYGDAIGALAFAATALERALKLWKGGVEVAVEMPSRLSAKSPTIELSRLGRR